LGIASGIRAARPISNILSLTFVVNTQSPFLSCHIKLLYVDMPAAWVVETPESVAAPAVRIDPVRVKHLVIAKCARLTFISHKRTSW
jgi:hypothetical protein